ncbi:outer membrane protein Iml2/Tetratricopeptide repeat protein 39 [Crepidotus variabilis]|uniref:Outer membrane protein Iml2/Tetratricopeptide repeat protein 39 n=1 Tax=Crepidotus variabilis TaxID=179855 RepID=A0A9P6E875_9AGAR|nr:outer membrane protein Iml2/Tetratricopeptide repeat protein 39 [Crepidotus variabilis]
MAESKGPPEHPNAAQLRSATEGFDFLFSNDITAAKKHFEPHDDPFHILGLGVCSFLEAALGMESGLMTEASRCLALAEAGTRRQMKSPKPSDFTYRTRFPHGLEWEILNADAVVLLGLTNALSESYMGYLQCMYSLNSAHSKFTKLYKTVFPNGLPSNVNVEDRNDSLSPTRALKHKVSAKSLLSIASTSSSPSASGTSTPSGPPPAATRSFFSRWVGTPAASSTPVLPLELAPDGPVEDLIVSGTAFGFGLFNLVFSLLPKKVQGLVGFFGFQSDRKLALQALAVSASKLDVHGVFSGLVIMTYHGVVLLMSGYQANEKQLLKEYEDIVDKVEAKYPDGALWILNRAKIKRMAYDAEGAIRVLEDGLKPERPRSFVQADIMLYFEMAWTLLSQRRYSDAADAFMKLTELNTWSHGTYYFISAGCRLAVGDVEKAQTLMDAIPTLIEKRKISGKDLPTEVFIKKKLTFLQEKHARRGGDPKKWIEAAKMNPAEEIAIFWNTHARISNSIAQAHIDTLLPITPVPVIKDVPPSTPISSKSSQFRSIRRSSTASSASATTPNVDLDTPDELAIRALLLGINYRTIGSFDIARALLTEAHGYTVTVSTWVGGIAMFELAVLDLKVADARTIKDGLKGDENRKIWVDAMANATAKLEISLSLAGSNVDLSSRLDSRIAMLKDEIAAKKDILGIV